MSKLNELFVTTIDGAIREADYITDKYQKAMIYATTAQALATYLGLTNGAAIENTVQEQPAPIAPVVPAVGNVHEEDLRLSEKNKEVIKAIDDAISKKPSWELPYDENGIPYLNEEDFADPKRVLAYENAMTPEIQTKKRDLEIAQGNAVLNESTKEPIAAAPTPVAQSIDPATFSQVDLDELENYKGAFNYNNDPVHLDVLYHNFTAGVHSSLSDITPETLNPFLIFIKEEIAKAFEGIESWKQSWITKEGLDGLIAQAYGIEGATIEDYLHDGNVFWFLNYVELYNANAFYGSYINGDIEINTLNNYVKQYFEDSTLTVDCITDENVIGFVYFVQGLMSQTA